MPPLPVLTPEQSAEWDRLAEGDGIAVATLMDAAGRGVASVLAARYATRLRQGVLIACGPGNNGGDGWVIARALHAAGVPIWVAPLATGGQSPLAAEAARLARADGVREVAPDGPWPTVALLVDAILGTGARGAPRPPAAALIDRLNDLQLPVVAVDGPTGIDLLDGVSHHPVPAHLTVTFGGYRRGHLLSRDEMGDLVVIDIGLPPPSVDWPTLLTETSAAQSLQPFPSNAHKGTRGRVVVVGGDAGMTGAARIAARAAFAAGSGLVHVVAPAESVSILAAAEPDLQTTIQEFSLPLAAAAALLDRADAVIVGPGLGREPSRSDFVLEILRRSRRALVDADALVALSGRIDALRKLAEDRMIVLTPHAGEFRTLFPALATAAAVDPWGMAAAAAAESGCVVLLKGVPTVVGCPLRPPITIAAGNPGLATGGSGDCLSGLIGSLLGQGYPAEIAAPIGAEVLGQAADIAARRVGVRPLRPMDVIAALTDLWRSWELLRLSPPAPRPPVLHELPRPSRG